VLKIAVPPFCEAIPQQRQVRGRGSPPTERPHPLQKQHLPSLAAPAGGEIFNTAQFTFTIKIIEKKEVAQTF
jgi:hypothetical protein